MKVFLAILALFFLTASTWPELPSGHPQLAPGAKRTVNDLYQYAYQMNHICLDPAIHWDGDDTCSLREHIEILRARPATTLSYDFDNLINWDIWHPTELSDMNVGNALDVLVHRVYEMETDKADQAAAVSASDSEATAEDDAAVTAVADAPAQTGSYVQADVEAIRALANDLKAKYNAQVALTNDLKAKYNAAVTLINELKTKLDSMND